jgi:hypothetical protein
MGQPVISGWYSVSGLDTRGFFYLRYLMYFCPFYLFP